MKHMKIRIYNTLGREKQIFTPIDDKSVRVYVCGPTIYDKPHIGNIRSRVVFDTLHRLLNHVYGESNVIFTSNLTDVDDKIITRARELGTSIEELTNETVKNYHWANDALNVLKPTIEPRATESIDDIIDFIQVLIKKGYAYVSEDHVFFEIEKAPFHGLLSGQEGDERKIGLRVEPNELKRNPADFVLWKPSDDTQPGWVSPWGNGRPGWHIECSAMIRKHLGTTIDIHGGGGDLIFPHHENEISQSVCAHGVDLANYWMHNGMILSDGRKMSKSLGNFVTVQDALNRVPGEALRLLILGSHYRKPLDFTWERLDECKVIMDKFYRALQETWRHEYYGEVNEIPEFVVDKLMDDLNTPEAIQIVHMMADNALNAKNVKERARLKINLVGAGKLLGILQRTPDEWFRAVDGADDVEAMIARRNELRAEKKFDEADAIRSDLEAKGIYLEDRDGQTLWRKE